MKEPPVVHAIENQKSRDDIAADMRPSGTADPPAMERPASEQKLPKPCVDQAETQCWFGSEDCLPQQTPQQRSNSTAETELEASQASQSQDAGASQQRDTQDAVDTQIAQEQLVPAEPSEPSGEPASEPAGESLVGQGLGGQADAISPMLHPPVRKSHLKHRLIGKQTSGMIPVKGRPVASVLGQTFHGRALGILWTLPSAASWCGCREMVGVAAGGAIWRLSRNQTLKPSL